MVVEVPPPKSHSHGGVFVKYSADGGSFAYYSSGRMAAAYERMGAGFYCYFYADDHRGTTLMAVDPSGCGYCAFPNGKPRLTSQMHGGTFCDETGTIVHSWTRLKPLRATDPIAFDLSPNITISFGSRALITAKLTVAGLTEVYTLGEVQKMASDSYMNKAIKVIRMGPERGKFVLDVDKCRKAAQENRERRAATAMKEIEVASTYITEDSMQKHPALRPIVASTEMLQASIGRGEWAVEACISKEKMASTLSGSFPTLSMGDTLRGDPHSRTLASLPAVQPDVLEALLKESGFDGRALPLSRSIKAASGRYRPEHGSHYKTPRKRLIEFKAKTYDAQVVDAAEKNTLVVVCCLAGWMPGCRRIEPTLETLNGELYRAAAGGDGAGSDAPAAAPAATSSGDLHSFVLRKFDMSESRFLRDRHNINSLPMFLMYLGGRLAYASNTLNGYGTSRDDMVIQARETLAKAQRGAFLPEGFKFGATDNNMTDKFSEVLTATAPSMKSSIM